MDSRRALALAFMEAHPRRAAASLERAAPADVAPVLEAAAPEVAARAVAAMAPLMAAACVAESAPDTARALLAVMPVDLATTILRRAPQAVVTRLLLDLPPTRAAAVRRLLVFPEGTVGALADPLTPTLATTARVGDAVTWLRAHPAPAHDVVFVVERDHRVAGLVPAHLLVTSVESQTLEDVMRPAPVVFHASMGAGTADASPVWATHLVAPVVDPDGRLVGGLRLAALRRYLDSRGEDPGGVAVGTLVRLGELYWSAWGRLLTELASAVTQPHGSTGGRHDDRSAAR